MDLKLDSDDSENEGGLVNISRAVMRPPDHSGKAKRGHLCFDASFETGNLGRVHYVDDQEYDLFIRPDTCNPRYRFWFNFTVENVHYNQRVIFNIVNLSKKCTLYSYGLTPLVKSTSRPEWRRIPTKQVFFHRSKEHGKYHVLTFVFCFDLEEDIYEFASSYPYSYSRLQQYFSYLDQEEFRLMQIETLATTIQQRNCPIISIGSSENDSGTAGDPRKVIVIMCRSHPGDSATSFIAQGLIDFLVGDHQMAVTLRKIVCIKIVPMLNPDGVFLGNESCTALGNDLNNVWSDLSELAHPTLHALKNLLVKLDQNRQLDVVLDIHSHNSLLGCFIYGNAYDDVYRHERHIVLPKALCQALEEFNITNTTYNRDSIKSGSARRHLCTSMSEKVNVYTFQISVFGYQKQNSRTVIPYTEEGYKRVGRCLARAFLSYTTSSHALPPEKTLRQKPVSEDKTNGRNQPYNRGNLVEHIEARGVLKTTDNDISTNISTADETSRHVNHRSLLHPEQRISRLLDVVEDRDGGGVETISSPLATPRSDRATINCKSVLLGRLPRSCRSRRLVSAFPASKYRRKTGPFCQQRNVQIKDRVVCSQQRIASCSRTKNIDASARISILDFSQNVLKGSRLEKCRNTELNCPILTSQRFKPDK